MYLTLENLVQAVMKTTHTLARKSYQPVIIQPRIANARPATRVMIDTYMAALGFEKTSQEGRFRNSQYEIWDLVPRNVLVDEEGDIFVVDAEIKQL